MIEVFRPEVKNLIVQGCRHEFRMMNRCRMPPPEMSRLGDCRGNRFTSAISEILCYVCNMDGGGNRAETKILVIGGSGGVGGAVSERLAGPGRKLIIHGGHNEEKLHAVTRRCVRKGARAQGFLTEIRCSEDLLRDAEQYLPVDVLVVGFGPWLVSTLDRTSLKEWRRMTELNLTLPGALVSACLPGMMEGRFGRIILFGGWGTERLNGFRDIAPYAAAKTGLGVLAASVAKAYAQYNISCTVISPSFVDTEYYSSEEKKKYKKKMPGGRMIDPAELAELAEYLVFSTGTLLNGAVIPAGGGFFQ